MRAPPVVTVALVDPIFNVVAVELTLNGKVPEEEPAIVRALPEPLPMARAPPLTVAPACNAALPVSVRDDTVVEPKLGLEITDI